MGRCTGDADPTATATWSHTHAAEDVPGLTSSLSSTGTRTLTLADIAGMSRGEQAGPASDAIADPVS